MGEVVTAIKRVNDIMSEIAAASSEQAAGIEEVSRAVVQMDEMTQQNAALVEEAAAASDSLKLQSAELSDRVAVFEIEKGTSKGHQSNDLEGHRTRLGLTPRAVSNTLKHRTNTVNNSGVLSPALPKDGEWESF